MVQIVRTLVTGAEDAYIIYDSIRRLEGCLRKPLIPKIGQAHPPNGLITHLDKPIGFVKVGNITF